MLIAELRPWGSWCQANESVFAQLAAELEAEAEAELEAEAEAEAAGTMLVVCPEGCGAGDLIAFEAPDGQQVEVVVPEGVGEGDEFVAAIPDGIEEDA